MRARFITAIAALLLALLPQVTAAASISGATDSSGRAVILTVHDQPAWAWFDADITVYCTPPTGSSTSRSVDGFYLWGTKYDADGNFVSAGYIGTTWTSCTGDSASRTYHLQLVLQGPTKVIELVTERRTWPYSASSGVGVERKYEGAVSP
jgi:hypothetical protein